MDPRYMLSVGLGAALILAQLWRTSRTTKPRTSGIDSVGSTEADTGGETEVWIELDVEPLFSSSEPVSNEYLLDVTESGERNRDPRP